ncbi:MAG: ATP-binding cassette domain-containing protein [Bacteroidia bacterium]|nr:ATP-binding cassette domain-containing protein [Bacteroidia bacterium]
MIEFQGVGKSFGGQQVLREVSCIIPDGAKACIIGGSGSGKSVMMKLLLGLEHPDAGSIRIDGADTSTFRPAEWQAMLAQFGVVFQGAALFDSLTVLENVGIRLYEAGGTPPQAIRAAVLDALERVGLGEAQLHKYPSELSGGMRKRVGIARAILQRPRYLVYDEPTTGLDPVSSLLIDSLMQELAREPHRTSIIITHDMATVELLADLVIMVAHQRLHFTGPPEAFFASDDPAVRNFLARGRHTGLTSSAETE